MQRRFKCLPYQVKDVAVRVLNNGQYKSELFSERHIAVASKDAIDRRSRMPEGHLEDTPCTTDWVWSLLGPMQGHALHARLTGRCLEQLQAALLEL